MDIKNFDQYDFSKKEIDGVPIYYKNLPWAPCIHIRVVFNTGAFDDPVGKEGMSHFLEHMIFDGSPTLPDKKSIREWGKLHALGSWNAGTGFYRTCYKLKCLPEEYNIVLSGMKDMIFNSYLRPEDIEHERKIITQEAWNRFLNEKFLKYNKEFVENLFHGHEHSRTYSPLGWPDTIAKISQKDIASWHKDNYGIGNLFIVLTGAVEEKHIEGLKSFLKDLPKVNEVIKSNDKLGKPKQNRFVKTADEIGEIKEQVEISLFRIAEKRSRLENEICNVSSKLIRDLLNERLRIEHSLCYGVDSSISKQKTFFQMFVNIKTEEKNVELVEKEFKNIVNEIIDEKFIDRFNTIKKLFIEQIRSAELLSDNIADNSIDDILKFDGNIITQAEQLKAVEKVTYDDIVKFTKWAFDPEYIYIEIILPSKK
ncbi:MAG: pitrilysin family protein [Minisyncoccia bacterium]